MTAVTVGELMEALRVHVSDNGLAIYDQLMRELKLRMWPTEVFEVALDIFGPAVYADTGRTRKALDRRIGHCLSVWGTKYGPLNLEQERYASSVICAAMRAGQSDHFVAGPGASGPVIAYTLTKLSSAVNHEVVHAGFKKRATAVPDRSAEIAGMVA